MFHSPKISNIISAKLSASYLFTWFSDMRNEYLTTTTKKFPH